MKRIFVPMTKVDAVQRLVYGVAAVEQLDKSKEIFDYAGSKPHFETWSADIEKLSVPAVQAFGEGARSFGNVREMHGKSAAGKLAQALGFDDVNKTIEVVSKVTDDKAWQKVMDGVYTGFSIGGEYEKVWDDPVVKGAKRYIAVPSEISLVDNPCIPGATFQFLKGVGGAMELRKFITIELTAEEIPAECYRVCKALAAGPTLPSAHSAAARVIDAGRRLNVDVSGFAKAYVDIHGVGLRKGGAGSGRYEAGSDGPGRADSASVGAMTASAVAEKSNKPEDHRTAAEAHMKAQAAHEKVAAPGSVVAAEVHKQKASVHMDHAKVSGGALAKGMYNIQDVASALSNLNWCRLDLESEAEWEGDGSLIPARLKGVVQTLSSILVDLVEEETSELTAEKLAKVAGETTDEEKTNVKKFVLANKAAIEKLAASSDAEVSTLAKAMLKESEEPASGAPVPVAVPAVVDKVAEGALAKATEDRLVKFEAGQAETKEQITNLTKAFAEFLSKTVAPSAVAPNPQAVAKTADGGAAPEKIDPKDPEAATKMMKSIHAAGPLQLIK